MRRARADHLGCSERPPPMRSRLEGCRSRPRERTALGSRAPSNDPDAMRWRVRHSNAGRPPDSRRERARGRQTARPLRSVRAVAVGGSIASVFRRLQQRQRFLACHDPREARQDPSECELVHLCCAFEAAVAQHDDVVAEVVRGSRGNPRLPRSSSSHQRAASRHGERAICRSRSVPAGRRVNCDLVTVVSEHPSPSHQVSDAAAHHAEYGEPKPARDGLRDWSRRSIECDRSSPAGLWCMSTDVRMSGGFRRDNRLFAVEGVAGR